MQTRSLWLVVVLSLCILSLTVPAARAEDPPPAGPAVYIVQLAEPPVASYRGGVPGFAATHPGESRGGGGGRVRLDAGSPDSQRWAEHLRGRQAEAMKGVRKVLGRSPEPLFQYTVAFNGVALSLTPEEAVQVARVPGVRSVHLSRQLQTQSDAGPDWIGASEIWDGSGTGGLPATQGEGMVVGVVDSGINASHPAFADVGGDGYNHTNPRGAGQYVGRCNPADPSYDPSFPCNDKLIGFWVFGQYYDQTPADETGHGTWMAALAAGNHVTANLSGPGITLSRPASGVAPHANLIAYDVCGQYSYCYESDILAGVDQAVADGVDVLSLGVGTYSYGNAWTDSLGAALLSAREAGVFVVVPAGNGGRWYDDSSLYWPAHAPWVLSVGASSHPRRFTNSLTSLSGGSTTPPPAQAGMGISTSYGPAPLVLAENYGDYECLSPFPAGTWTGQIVVCSYYPYYYSSGPLAQISANVLAGGAGGLVLLDGYSEPWDLLPADLDGLALPGVYIRPSSYAIWDWLYDGTGQTGKISGTSTQVAAAFADILWPGSSLGPNTLVPGVLKPDLTAPGVEILAPARTGSGFVLQSGTSMAAGHAAGAAALLLDLHPDWTPAEVQSALMTTASPTVVRTNGTAAGAFQAGAGRIDIPSAARAGLLLDVTGTAFTQADPSLGGDPEALNLAGLAGDRCVRSCSWTRTVRNVLSSAATWNVSASVPAGFSMAVVPSSFTLAPGASRTLQITFNAATGYLGTASAWLFLTEAGGQAPQAHLPVGAEFVPEYQVTITKSGSGSGSVSSAPAGIDCGVDCSEPFPEDTWVTLTATPSPGSVFVGWNDNYGYCDVDPVCSFDLWSARSLTAWFVVPPPDKPLANGAPVKDSMDGPVEFGTWSYYYVDVPAGQAELVVDLFDLSSSDAGLYVRAGAKPTFSSYNCADTYWWDTPNRRCVISQPQAGRWWIGVNNDYTTGPLRYSLRASWGSANDRVLANRQPVSDFVYDPYPGGGWKYYFFDVEAGATDLQVELAGLSADADLFVRYGAKPDRSTYDCASSESSTLPDRCSFVTPTPGRWWVAVNNFSAGTVSYTLQASWMTSGTSLYTVPPCRVFDTRQSSPLAAGMARTFTVGGVCGIPANARAVVANITSVIPATDGFATFYPGGLPMPAASTINFRAGTVRANNAVIGLAPDGSGTIGVTASGPVNLILDVSGYFQ